MFYFLLLYLFYNPSCVQERVQDVWEDVWGPY